MPSPLRLAIGSTLAASILAIAPLTAHADTLYTNDFSAGIAGTAFSGTSAAWAWTFTEPSNTGLAPEWTGATLGIDVTPKTLASVGSPQFLGREETFTGQSGDSKDVSGRSGSNYANTGLGNDMVRLGLTNVSGAATKITVSFDLLIIHSWNGNGGKVPQNGSVEDGPNESPDFFTFGYSTTANSTDVGTIGGGASFSRGFNATFANHNASVSQPQANRQSFGGAGNGAPILGSTDRNADTSLTYANETGAAIANDPLDTNDLTPKNPLGYTDRFGATLYHILYDITDADMLSSAAVYFFFGGSNLESYLLDPTKLIGPNNWYSTAIGDESWGIDNLDISRVTAVPLPPPALLLLSALVTGAGFVRRRA